MLTLTNSVYKIYFLNGTVIIPFMISDSGNLAAVFTFRGFFFFFFCF